MSQKFLGLFAFLVLSAAANARAEEVRVAVAANFTGTFEPLSEEFTKKTGHKAVVVSGASGKLFAQISNGAPFEVFLAADKATPSKLEASGFTVPKTRFTYALGKLALYSAKPGFVDATGSVLEKSNYAHLAIANPKLAPYGIAALSVLQRMGLLGALEPKLVKGENIAQTFEFIASGNAELGFVALSQVFLAGKSRPGSYWVVPETLYPPIEQDAVILKKGAKNPAAGALAEFLKSASARALIESHGYGLPAAQSRTPQNKTASVPRID